MSIFPNEIYLNIFKFLGSKELMNTSMTCVSLYHLIKDCMCMFNINLSGTLVKDKNLEYFSKVQKINLIKCINITDKGLLKLSNIKYIKLPDYDFNKNITYVSLTKILGVREYELLNYCTNYSYGKFYEKDDITIYIEKSITQAKKKMVHYAL